MNDSPRQDPAYTKSILFDPLILNNFRMKSLILTLLLIPSLLLAQETPSEPKEAVIVETFDLRCKNELLYGVQLVEGRKRGLDVYTILEALQYQRRSGNLQKYPEEVISYTIDIILIVYNTEDVTSIEGSIGLMREIEKHCVEFKSQESSPPEKEKSESIST